MESVLITGGNGYLGSQINNVLKKHYSTFILSRNNGDFLFDLSLTIPKFYNKFNIIIHCAGRAHKLNSNNFDDSHFYNVNVNGTKNLLSALHNSGLPDRFVFISSVSVYGLDTGQLISEEHPLNAKDAYGHSKIIAENIVINWCKTNNVKYTILRLPLIVSLNPPGNLGSMIRSIEKGYYFNINNGTARKSMVLAEDVANFIIKASNKGGVYNLTDGIHPSFYDLSMAIAKKRKRHKILNLPFFIAKILAIFGDFVGQSFPINKYKLLKITSTLTFDDSKAKKSFQWNPKSVVAWTYSNY